MVSLSVKARCGWPSFMSVIIVLYPHTHCPTGLTSQAPISPHTSPLPSTPCLPRPVLGVKVLVSGIRMLRIYHQEELPVRIPRPSSAKGARRRPKDGTVSLLALGPQPEIRYSGDAALSTKPVMHYLGTTYPCY